MTNMLKQPGDGLTDEEIRKTFERLGLADPRVRHFYDQLEALEEREEDVTYWIETHGDTRFAATKADSIVEELGSHSLTLSHDRHLSAERCRELGLVIESLEENQELQDGVLSVHHACIHTLSATRATKIIENHNGVAFINSLTAIPTPK